MTLFTDCLYKQLLKKYSLAFFNSRQNPTDVVGTLHKIKARFDVAVVDKLFVLLQKFNVITQRS